MVRIPASVVVSPGWANDGAMPVSDIGTRWRLSVPKAPKLIGMRAARTGCAEKGGQRDEDNLVLRRTIGSSWFEFLSSKPPGPFAIQIGFKSKSKLDQLTLANWRRHCGARPLQCYNGCSLAEADSHVHDHQSRR
jgi:hypothetical protein